MQDNVSTIAISATSNLSGSRLYLNSDPASLQKNNTTFLFLDSDALLLKYNEQEVRHMFPVVFFYGVILTIGLFGNLLVLLVYTFRYKRSQARVFILFLATNDFLMCLFGLPYQVMDMTHPYTYTYSVLCKVSSFIIVSLFYISVFGLVVIAVDRYTKICHPLGTFHTQYFGKKRACVIAVILGLLLSWPILILYGPSEMETGQYNITGHACYYMMEEPESIYVIIHSITTLCFCVGSTVCLIVLYSLVFYQIYTRYHRGASLQSLKRPTEDNSTCCISEDENKTHSKPFHADPMSRHRQGVGYAVEEKDIIFTVQSGNTSSSDKYSTDQEVNLDITREQRILCDADDIDAESDDEDEDCLKNFLIDPKTRGLDWEMISLTQTTNMNTFSGTDKVDEGTRLMTNPSKHSKVNMLGNESIKRILDDTAVSRDTARREEQAVDSLKQVRLENYNDDGAANAVSENTSLNSISNISEDDNNSSNETQRSNTCQDDDNLAKNVLRFELDSGNSSKPFEQTHTDGDIVRRERSRSVQDMSRGSSKIRLSLPINSLHQSKSSMNSGKDSATVSRKSVTFGENGLRIHNSANQLNQPSKNYPDNVSSRGHSKITKIMITITTLFILSYTPTLIIILRTNIQSDVWDVISIHETLVFEFCLRFYLINNICNPFIYGFWDKRFKREVIFTLRKLVRIFRSNCA